MQFFCDIILCQLVKSGQHFKESYYHDLQGKSAQEEFSSTILWNVRKYLPTNTELTFQKTWIYNNTMELTSDVKKAISMNCNCLVGMSTSYSQDRSHSWLESCYNPTFQNTIYCGPVVQEAPGSYRSPKRSCTD
jgi:hypothetical protein